jgi:oxygen-independent coproporphyrinogen III oxidase
MSGAARLPEIPAGLLERYGVAAPRYTSYPTAVDWRGNFDPATYAERLQHAAKADAPLAIYVHVPFCERRCLFCGCNVVITKNHDKATPYLDDLEREIAAARATGIGRRKVTQYQWGGGTPTFLSESEIERLHGLITGAFAFEPDAEIAIEVDPRHCTPGQIRTLKRLGFNRLSAGVQDFDPKVQEAIHRVQSEEQTRAVVDEARAAGFGSINIDLIYGLPYQTLEGFDRTLDRILDIRPERIALFHYAHVPWIRKHQEALPVEAFPDAATRARIFVHAIGRLGAGGYELIGLDHFALPDDELARARRDGSLQRNFMGYTTRRGTDLVPFGVSSIGEIGGAFVQNPREVDAWSARARTSGHAVERGHVLDRDDQIRRDVIMRMMCHARVDKRAIESAWNLEFDEAFAVEIADLEGPEKDGLITRGADSLEATPLGQLFLRNLAVPFDRYFRERKSRPDGLSRTFSRTL